MGTKRKAESGEFDCHSTDRKKNSRKMGGEGARWVEVRETLGKRYNGGNRGNKQSMQGKKTPKKNPVGDTWKFGGSYIDGKYHCRNWRFT